MDGTEQKDERGGVSVRALELIVAALIMTLAALVIYDRQPEYLRRSHLAIRCPVDGGAS